MRILLLDDQPGFAEMLAMSLRASGYSAFSFTDPTEVLEALREGDILVTDYRLCR